MAIVCFLSSLLVDHAAVGRDFGSGVPEMEKALNWRPKADVRFWAF